MRSRSHDIRLNAYLGFLSAFQIIKCAQRFIAKARYFDVDQFTSTGIFIGIILPVKVLFAFTTLGISYLEL